MKVSDLRTAIDRLDEERRGFCFLSSDDFVRAPVADRLQERVGHLAAVQIPRGHEHDAKAREVAIANALDLIERWRHLQAERRRPRSGGCCGR